MAKHKLTQLKQLDFPVHEYLTKFRDMVEYAYSIKPKSSQILASSLIEGLQKPHLKNKLRSYQITNLKEIFGHAINKNQNQKIRALHIRVNSKPKSIINCDINAIREKVCFKCGSDSHSIKDCPLSKQDTKVPQRKYTNHKTNTNTNSMPDKVMEPLTRLFTNFIEQLRLLTPLGHNPHNGHPNCKGNGQCSQKQAAYPISHRQHGTTTHHWHRNAHRDHINDQRHQTDHRWKDITGMARPL